MDRKMDPREKSDDERTAKRIYSIVDSIRVRVMIRMRRSRSRLVVLKCTSRDNLEYK